jgi:molecular chaperone GrpE
MNEQAEVEAILEKFRDWLEDARALADGQEGVELGLDSEPGPPQREFGIIDLVEEFTALRHELKLQTKSGRGLIEQTENTVGALRQAIEHFRSVEPKEAQAVWSAAKALAEALADLDEAVVRGEREIDRARRQIADEAVRDLETSVTNLFRGRSWVRRRFLRSFHQEVIETVRRDSLTRHELFESFLEGYRLIHKRLRKALLSEQVVHIPCEGKPVDPELMTVIEVVDEPRDRPGTVAKELRRGYTWKGRVIRFAEVQAVRGAWRSPSAPDDENADESEPDEDNGETGTVDDSGDTQDSRSGAAQLEPSEG